MDFVVTASSSFGIVDDSEGSLNHRPLHEIIKQCLTLLKICLQLKLADVNLLFFPQEMATLATFIEKILNGKLRSLCRLLDNCSK